MSFDIVLYIALFLALYFEVFLLISFIDSRRSTATPLPDSKLPTVTIVVPCFNEEPGIARSIASLLALDYPKDKLSITIVDDGSTDNTYEIARAYTFDPRVTLIKKKNGGKHTALNLVLSDTKSEFIGCLDADSTVQSDALRHIITGFTDADVAAVTPGIIVREPRSTLQHIQNVEYRLSIFHRFALAAIGSVFITPGPFSFLRVSAVRAVGGWKHAHSTEDMEMGMRLQEHGYRIVNVPLARVETTTPATLRTLIRQRVRWTYGFLRNALDYRHMFGNPTYGNLGLIVLPTAVISIFSAILLATHVLWGLGNALQHILVRFSILGFHAPVAPSLFYVNTSVILLLSLASLASAITLIVIGSRLSGHRYPPLSTPVFLVLYGFIVPLWLTIAVVRAALNTGVKWR